jgi:hypothetical protein
MPLGVGKRMQTVWGVRKLNCLVALMLDINLYPIVF